MNLIKVDKKNIHVLQLDERIIMPNSDTTKKEIKDLLAKEEVEKLVINLHRVDFLDSTGVGVLLSIFKYMQENNGAIVICELQKAVNKIIKITKMDIIIPVYSSVEEAVNSFDE